MTDSIPSFARRIANEIYSDDELPTLTQERSAYKISSLDDLLEMTPAQLSNQASLILMGEPDLLDEACDREIIQRLYIPRNLNKPIIYKTPKSDARLSARLKKHYVCEDCGRARSYNSGRRCKYCYTLRVRLKFYEKSEGSAWLDYQARGIVMPETEWWSDTDIARPPEMLAAVAWKMEALDWRKA